MTQRWKTPARQERSLETERRIVDAAAALLETHRYDELSIAAVAKAARVSVGGLYARFCDKQALVHAVDERLVEEMDRAVVRALAPNRIAALDVEGVVRSYVQVMVRFFSRRRGLVRQVVLRARSSEDRAFTERIAAFNDRAHGALTTAVLARRDQFTHEDPEAAVPFAILFASAAAREACLFAEQRLNLSSARGRALVEELVRAFCAYLGAPFEGASR